MSSNTVFLTDLKDLQSRLGGSQNIRGVDAEQPVIAGHFQYLTFQSGLSMHAMDAVEHQNTESTMELPEGLSFNFMFSGTIDFSFADQQYRIGPDQRRVSCSVIINNSMDILTRSMCAGMHIKKVNVFVERHWLARRCNSPEEVEQLNRLFEQKRVYQWLPEQPLLDKALRLFEVNKVKGLADQLAAEALTLDLLAGCLNHLHRDLETQREGTLLPGANPSQALKQAIDQALDLALDHGATLADIAATLGMSERTLQRRFQSAFHQSVSSYLRQKRLEQAKKALAIEGRSIGEAAYLAGYNHCSNFVNAFKKQFGMTPAEFVKTHQGLRH